MAVSVWQHNQPIMNPTPCYNSHQLYAWEQAWFAQGNSSFGLMQQAAWQMAIWLEQFLQAAQQTQQKRSINACILVGSGNNGGDGWLVAHYLCQQGVGVTVLEIAPAKTTDAMHAKAIALADNNNNTIHHVTFQDNFTRLNTVKTLSVCDVYIDAMFGIGLDRQPTGHYAHAIQWLNEQTNYHNKPVVAIDIPSGLQVNTGQVFDGVAVKASYTLCLVGLKQGLFFNDGQDYAGQVHYLALIPDSRLLPVTEKEHLPTPNVWLHTQPPHFAKRQQNSHKGSYGHVLIIGGNLGMGGAGILSAQAAIGVGAGKVTLACASQYHNAVLSRCPNVMLANLHDTDQLTNLISQVDVVAMGMGLGRDKQAQHICTTVIQQVMASYQKLLCDADALYHLADWANSQQKNGVLALFEQFKNYSHQNDVYFTPHSAEAARLLACSVAKIDTNKPQAIQQLAQTYGGDWLLKGAGSLVYQADGLHLCGLGNAGMASAGMGDVLAGMAAGLLAQTSLNANLLDAVLLHAKKADVALTQTGELELQATDL